MIGIFCSIQSEFLNIVKQYAAYRILEQKKDFCVAQTNENTIVVLLGVGSACAYQNSSYVLKQYKEINYVVSTGIAGSLIQTAQLGDYVLGDYVIHYTEKKEFEECIPSDIENQEKFITLINQKHKILKGMVVSSDMFIHEKDEKEILRKRGGICVEMEAAGVLKACSEKKIPCMVIKIISDTADQGALKSIIKNQEMVTIQLGKTLSKFSDIFDHYGDN